MSPALRPGDYVVTRRRVPLRGSVIVFEHPQRPDFYLMKRVVGMPGERVEIRSGRILINGTELKEPWTADSTEPEGLWNLSADQVFVLGDARHRSADDGRTLGPLPLARQAEVVWLRYWPAARIARITG